MECKNCSANLQDKDGFCSYCGARVLEKGISLKFLISEIMDKVLSVDNKLLKTFWQLFSKPDQVINGYIDGVRKKYFNPFSYLLISITLAGISFYFLKDIAIQSLETAPTINQTGNPFGDKQFLESFLNFIFDYQAFLTALIIPVYALISWVVFLNRKKYNYLEHVIIYIYASAQISILNFIVATPVFFIDSVIGNYISLGISSLSVVYNSYILIRLFKLTFWRFIVKFLYFLFVGSVLYFIWSMIAGIILVLYLGPEFFDRFKKPQKKDSIQKVQPIDSTKVLQKNDSILKDKKTISFYEASSKLNCLS
ncbi:DUF3667 domain-containing protein [Pseudotenacibaculum sp. MALMAid0570]|uniref:DUF3667 domain-containing protein n=1 Tax=Pseudotenacibaculum sp. MALMAid0570 TaxID=3143938 RepID=UPI0032DE6ED9